VADGGDPGALTALGAAYVGADRPSEALAVLHRAVQLDTARTDARFFMGLALEDLDRPDEAAEAYRAFLVGLPMGEAREHVAARIRKLQQEETRAAIRAALEQEERLGQSGDPAPATVAVLPFAFRGEDEQLRPLGRALAHMLATDLSATARLTVLERLEVQALLDELQLAESGLVDPATAARSGRLLGAAEIVQGALDDLSGALTIEASVVPFDAGAEGLRPVTVSDDLERFYELEARLALRIYEALGIALTAAERERINRRPTQSLEALLLFGRGLEEEAAGRYGLAADLFGQAAALDAGFEMAQSAASSAAALADVVSLSPAEAFEIVLPPAMPIDLGVEAVLDQAGIRDAVQEALGSEGIGRDDVDAVIRIFFPRPGGGV
jgi:tetratricopeptide (TPR) repeat protein